MRRSATVLSLLALTAFSTRAPLRVPLSISLSPSAVAGGNPVTGTILLSSPAGNSGLTVTLTAPPGITIDAGANAVSGGPQGSTRISVPAGATSVTFRVLSAPVASIQQALISGVSGSDAATATLTIKPASVRSIAVSPSTVTGGTAATLSVTLDGPLASGLGITLSSQTAGPLGGSVQIVENPVSVPPTIQPAAGQTSATQALTTFPVTVAQSVTISAFVSSTAVLEAVPRLSPSTVLTVAPPVVTALQLSPAAVTGGTSANATIVLTGPAPSKGMSVALHSSDSAASVVPTVILFGGADRSTFLVATHPVSLTHTVTITASQTLPSASASASLVVAQPKISALSINPTAVFGGAPAVANVSLDGPAPALGFVVRLSSNTASAVVPASTTVAAGSRGASIPIKTSLSSTAIVTATIGAGGQSLTSGVTDGTSNTVQVSELPAGPSATLSISSQVLGSVTTPDSARGSSAFTLVLSPASGVATPVTVSLATNHPELLGLPATVQISPNLTSKVLVTTKAVTARITGVTVTATAGSSAIVRTLVVTP
jgi:hypothetical protein